jgi:CBS domain-containing protein
MDAALTADLIATARDSLVLAARDEQGVVATQMERPPRYDILPVDSDASRFWVNPRAIPRSAATAPTVHDLGARDLVACSTSILEVIRLMAEYRRGFYFVLRGGELTGLITYADLNRRAVRTALFALVNEVEEVLIELLEACELSGLSKLRYADLSQEVRLRVRNKVAHPGRLLISRVEDVDSLRRTCAFIETALLLVGDGGLRT